MPTSRGKKKNLGIRDTTKSLSVAEGGLHEQLLDYVRKNLPLVRRSDIVHNFQDLGFSRTYIYGVISELINMKYLQPNSLEPQFIEIPSVIKKLMTSKKK